MILASLDLDEAHHAACAAAPRIAGAEVFYTLDLRDFQSLVRPGDPRIKMP